MGATAQQPAPHTREPSHTYSAISLLEVTVMGQKGKKKQREMDWDHHPCGAVLTTAHEALGVTKTKGGDPC